ncbi:tRNA-dihydrouridine synthase-like protein 4-like protein [Cryomyces antarcticus]
MILAKEFNRSSLARDSDFTTNARDTPLIAQFGASCPLEFARAASLVQPYVSGDDLNCGCPQGWAFQEGLGASLMRHRGRVSEMVRQAKERCGKDFCVKLTVHRDTIDFVRTVEAAGADFITVHGRLPRQRSSTPPSLSAIKLVKNHTNVPVLANGDVFSLSDVHKIIEETGVDGVMAARGLLENPALFAGYTSTPAEAVTKFMNNAMRCPLPHKLLLHHLSEMTGTLLTKKERAKMMDCRDTIALIDWLDENIDIQRPI